ncbi:serine/threonine-protein kinase [Idiomarina xiamenensis]|uniref:Serine/threonine protein kinase n=1 Tax=Idiomarina xiamenensis 10-D-4 TaxID=740709 RepID=K2LCC1_9GAMM|nr:serine/threonine-protein kinase [Idiomarina xiamenensis]EKE87515.1 serine/threonine protein kinase [Idiomarina xiamenensis 10-D-4]
MNDNEQTILPGQDNPDRGDTPRHSFPYSINARYSCLELLGRGGSGAVYRARDNKLQRDVAIKFINTDQRLARDRFISEARLLAKLEHDRICRVYEVAEEGPALYMVMQYVAGATLNDWRTLLTTRQLVEAIQQVAAGVAAVHQQGVIHRDIKPANIALTTDNQQGVKAVLLDFGIASDISNATLGVHAGQGSLFYMAPEQAKLDPQQITPAADVYSLGATLYFLLSGEPVLASRRTTVARAELSQDNIIPLQQLCPKLPDDLAQVVMHCLQRDPTKRYQSAQQLADDLQRWLNHQPVSLIRSPAYRIAKWYRRSPAAGVMITGLSLVLIAALVLFAYYQQQVGVRELRLQRFTEQVKNIEAEVRFIRMSPMTYIEDDMRQLSRRAEQFAAQAVNDSDFFAGPAWYAAGRTFYSLGRFNDAYHALQQAWQSDYQNPNAALYLALTHSELYQQGQQFAASIQNPSERERYLQQLQDEHQQPALSLLQRMSEGSQSESIPRSYLRAVAAYLNDDLNAADSILQQARDIPTWFYEAERLAATLDYQRAIIASNVDDIDNINKFYEAAKEHYQALENVAPNYTSVYLEHASLTTNLAAWFLKMSGDVTPYIQAVEHLVQQASEQRATKPELWAAKSQLVTIKAQLKNIQSESTLSLFALALSQAEKAYRLSVHDSSQRDNIRLQLLSMLRDLIRQFERDGLPLESLVARFRAVAADVPKHQQDIYFYYNNAVVYQSLAISELKTNGDTELASHYLERTRYWFESAINSHPERSGLYLNYANFLTRASSYLSHSMALDLLHVAQQTIDIGLTFTPDSWAAWYFKGAVHDELAKFDNLMGISSDVHYKTSLSAYEKAKALNPESLFPIQAILSPLIYRGIYLDSSQAALKQVQQQIAIHQTRLAKRIEERTDDNISNHFYLLGVVGNFMLAQCQQQHFELPDMALQLVSEDELNNPNIANSLFISVSAIEFYLNSSQRPQINRRMQHRVSMSNASARAASILPQGAYALAGLSQYVVSPSQASIDAYEDAIQHYRAQIQSTNVDGIIMFDLLRFMHKKIMQERPDDKQLEAIFQQWLRQPPQVEIKGQGYSPATLNELLN